MRFADARDLLGPRQGGALLFREQVVCWDGATYGWRSSFACRKPRRSLVSRVMSIVTARAHERLDRRAGRDLVAGPALSGESELCQLRMIAAHSLRDQSTARRMKPIAPVCRRPP